jgi:hypothetical protein
MSADVNFAAGGPRALYLGDGFLDSLDRPAQILLRHGDLALQAVRFLS